MTAEEWLASSDTIAKSKRPYAHFDHRTDIGKKRDYISDSEKIAHHGFYPFIHYKQMQVKYSKEKGQKTKERDICYAAHIDRCIYQYYSFLLNELYNQRVEQDGISQVAVAYRTDLHQNNIDFAKRAIDFVCSHAPCYVMIGDFTGFFDHLDHKYLKQQWCSLLGGSKLPPDHYNVFKSVTQYSAWELTDLLALNHLENNRIGRKQLNAKAYVLTPREYKAYSNKEHIKKNPDPFGIPQGSSISGLLANVYMLEIDKIIHDLVVTVNGLYMRYSDDFIVVIPDRGESTYAVLREVSARFNAVVGLELKPEKTQYFRFENQELENCGGLFGVPPTEQKRFINFLGFTFDGKKVSIRTKTTGKYYYRMRSKARTIRERGGCSPKGNRISGNNLYALYSRKGAHGYVIRMKNGKLKRGSGNFISYVYRVKSSFGKDMLTEKVICRHMGKIKKAVREKPGNQP